MTRPVAALNLLSRFSLACGILLWVVSESGNYCILLKFSYLPRRTRAKRSRALAPSERMLLTQLHRSPGTGVGAAPAQTIYVIEDDASLRRALERLLSLYNWSVRTFDTAEAFLAELDKLSSGCLIVDIDLQGMN